MLKNLLIFCAVLFCTSAFGQADTARTTAPAQKTIPAATTAPPPKIKKDTRPLKSRLAFGLGTGFWITPGQTYVEVAPLLAYRFPKILITGIGYRYIYRHERYLNNDLHSYGPNIFARANLTKRIFLWTEYEYLNTQHYNGSYVNNEVSRSTSQVNSWFAGLGFVRRVGKRGGFSMMLLYNVLHDRNQFSPYYNAFTYRVGYFF